MKKILAMVLALTLSTGFLASCGQAKIPDDVTITNMEEFEDNSVNALYDKVENQLDCISKNDLEKFIAESNVEKMEEAKIFKDVFTLRFDKNVTLCNGEKMKIKEMTLHEKEESSEDNGSIVITIECGSNDLYGLYDFNILDGEYVGAILLSEKDPYAISFDGVANTCYNVFAEYYLDMETKGYILKDGEYKFELGKTDYSDDTTKVLAERAAEAATSDFNLNAAEGYFVKVTVSSSADCGIEKVEISKTDNFANPDGAYAP